MEITSIPSTISPYSSNYEGFVGIQPYQSDLSLNSSNINLMQSLRENNLITNEVMMV